MEVEAGQISKQFTAEIPMLLGLSKVTQSGLSQQKPGQSFHPILVLGYDGGDVKTDVVLGEQLVVTVTRPDKK